MEFKVRFGVDTMAATVSDDALLSAPWPEGLTIKWEVD